MKFSFDLQEISFDETFCLFSRNIIVYCDEDMYG